MNWMGMVKLRFIQVEQQSRLPNTQHAEALPDSFKITTIISGFFRRNFVNTHTEELVTHW